MSKSTKNIAIVLAAVQSLLFVLMGVWARFMNDSFTVSQQVFWRMIIAGIFVWLLFGNSFSKKLFRSITPRDWCIYLIRSLLYFGAGVMLITFSVNHTTLGVVSFASSLPVVGVFAWIMFKEKLDLRAVPFILLSVLGLAMLSKIDVNNIHISSGLLTAFLSLIAFDISYLMVRYHKAKISNFQNTTLLLSFAWIVPLLFILLRHENFIPNHISSRAVLGMLLSSIFNVINLYLLNYIFMNLKGYVAGNVLLLEGVFALIIGGAFYNESISLVQYFGAALILIAAIVISYFEKDQSDSVTP
jgi:drug/metabolite transporter (DMT)-like permease